MKSNVLNEVIKLFRSEKSSNDKPENIEFTNDQLFKIDWNKLFNKALFCLTAGVAFAAAYVAPDYTKGFQESLGIAWAGENPVKNISDADREASEKYNFRGIVMWRKGKFDKAIGYFKKAIEMNPNEGANYGMIAQCYLDKGEKIEKALTIAEKGLKLASDDQHRALAYGRIGRAYAQLGKCDEASKYVELYIDYYIKGFGASNMNYSKVVKQITTFCK